MEDLLLTDKEKQTIESLLKCYIKLEEEIILGRQCYNCPPKSYEFDETIYKRDLIKMSLIALDYYTKLGDIEKIKETLKALDACPNLCENGVEDEDCGCN